MLNLTAWLTQEQCHAMQGGGAVFAADPNPVLLPFCERHRLPWAPRGISLWASSGPAADRVGRVSVSVDVPWILQDLKLAGPAPLVDELLALWALEQDGQDISAPLRRVSALTGGSPAARADAIARLLRRGPVEVRLLRALTDDDVEDYRFERRLAVL